MALTPIDVQQKTFGTALRGYDLDEVDDFLDEVVTSLKSYEERLVESQERIAALQAELEGKGDSESAISRALVTAQRSADNLVAEAEADADRIRSEAQLEADEMLAAARSEREQLDAVRSEQQAKLDAELTQMREGIAAIRAKVLDLNASIGADLDAMDEAVSAPVSAIDGTDVHGTDQPSEAGEPAQADGPGYAWDTPAASDEVLPTEPTPGPDESTGSSSEEASTEEASAEPPKWYEASAGHADQELEFDGDDEAAAAGAATGTPTDGSDHTSEMSTPVDAPTDSDPLDDAIADATFQGGEGPAADDAEVDDGWGSSDEAEEAEESEAWEEAWGSEEDERPRRPWE